MRRRRSRGSPPTHKRHACTSRQAVAWPPTTCSPTSWCGNRATIRAAPTALRSRQTVRPCTPRSLARRNGSWPTRQPARRSRRSTSPAIHTTRNIPTMARFVYFEAEGNTRTMSVVDAATRTIVKEIGPFGNMVRPFTFNGRQTLLFANINDFLGFEVADLKTRPDPASRRGARRHGRAIADARHPEPRHRHDAGRNRDLDRRQRKQLPADLRRDGHAAGDENERQSTGRTWLDHVRHRRHPGLSVNRRCGQREIEADRGDTAGRKRRERRERKDARNRFRRRASQSGPAINSARERNTNRKLTLRLSGGRAVDFTFIDDQGALRSTGGQLYQP